MKKALKTMSNLVTFILFVALLLMAFLVISSKAAGGEPQVFGYQFKTVLSGSMEPTFQTGSIIGVEPVEGEEKKQLKEGDVITFVDSEERLITHRIIGVEASGEHVMYQTKGDNNNTADQELVLSDNVQAVYADITIPYIGYLIDYAQSKEGGALLLIVPGLLLLGYSAFSIYQGLRELESISKKAETKESAV